MKLRVFASLCLASAALVSSACRTTAPEDPILALSATESLVQGKELLAAKKYVRARPYLLHAFEVEPNSANGRESLLLAADTYFLEGGRANFVQAEAKYRDFLNRFPTSDRASYAQFQVATSLARRMERPDRDQATTRQALQAYEDLQRQFPTSEYAAQAREQIRLVRDNLAEHELVVGRFYLNYGIAVAAVSRLEYMLEAYPEYSARDKIFFYLGQAYGRSGRDEDARATFERLRNQFQDSPYLAELPKVEKNLAKLAAKRKRREARQEAEAARESGSSAAAKDEAKAAETKDDDKEDQP
jgi:outer membrane protein assembly factor BamD